MPTRHHWPATTAAAFLLIHPTTTRTALTCTGVALQTLLALTTAYAPRPANRTAARHTLHLLLRLAPWYPDREAGALCRPWSVGALTRHPVVALLGEEQPEHDALAAY
ncbi:hypothetical protein ACFV5G_08615 [Streptomyces sp. NPDC059766]|uniref:hypothetical protein n=1 Tax=Streptomyces sp. NPDC059766 TaxID=3346940 RepID=UPI003661C3D5